MGLRSFRARGGKGPPGAGARRNGTGVSGFEGRVGPGPAASGRRRSGLHMIMRPEGSAAGRTGAPAELRRCAARTVPFAEVMRFLYHAVGATVNVIGLAHEG